MTTESLNEREQQTLEHLQKAQELGSSLAEYASVFGLEVKELYAMKQQLVRKGILPPTRGKTEEAEKAEKPSPFVAVRVVPTLPAAPSPMATCRLTHPSGWVIECGTLPPAAWLASVLSGGAHAAA